MFPWVSKRAYHEVCRQRDRLEAQVDRMLVHVTAMDRIDHGLKELTPERQKPKEPMPAVIREELAAWGAQREFLAKQVERLYAETGDWEEVLVFLQADGALEGLATIGEEMSN